MNTKKLIKYYLINADEEGELRYKLKLTHEDKKTFEKIISHLCSDEEIEFTNKDSKNIITNFKYFKREINEDNAQDIFNGFKKLLIIIISLKESIDNPQLIFESLNSTGLPLTKADLIRNYVLMGLSPVEQDNIYNSYWHNMELLFEENKSSFDEFIKHYITIKNNKVPVYREIYIQFKKYAQKFINNYEADNKFEKIKALVKDINKYVKYYSKITMGLEEDNDIKYALNSLHEINYNVTYPFILKVYEDYDNKVITKSECIEIINLTESYLLRRYICDIPSNSMQKTFSELYNELDKNNYLESFKAVMILKDTYKRIPSNKEYKEDEKNQTSSSKISEQKSKTFNSSLISEEGKKTSKKSEGKTKEDNSFEKEVKIDEKKTEKEDEDEKIDNKKNIYFDEIINNRLRGVSRMDSLEIVLERRNKEYSNQEKIGMAEYKNNLFESRV